MHAVALPTQNIVDVIVVEAEQSQIKSFASATYVDKN